MGQISTYVPEAPYSISESGLALDGALSQAKGSLSGMLVRRNLTCRAAGHRRAFSASRRSQRRSRSWAKEQREVRELRYNCSQSSLQMPQLVSHLCGQWSDISEEALRNSDDHSLAAACHLVANNHESAGKLYGPGEWQMLQVQSCSRPHQRVLPLESALPVRVA